MNKQLRKPVIAGNWKMNNTIAAGTQLIKDLAPLVKDVKDVDIVACPTATALAAVAAAAKVDSGDAANWRSRR